MSKNHPIERAFNKLRRKALDKKAHKRAIKSKIRTKQNRKIVPK